MPTKPFNFYDRQGSRGCVKAITGVSTRCVYQVGLRAGIFPVLEKTRILTERVECEESQRKKISLSLRLGMLGLP